MRKIESIKSYGSQSEFQDYNYSDEDEIEDDKDLYIDDMKIVKNEEDLATMKSSSRIHN